MSPDVEKTEWNLFGSWSETFVQTTWFLQSGQCYGDAESVRERGAKRRLKEGLGKNKTITQTSKASLASFELGLDGLCVWNSCGAHQTLKLFLNTKIQSLAPALRKLGVFIWDDADRRTSLHGWKCDPLQKAEKADWDLVFWSGTIPWTTRACGPALRENGRFSSICYGFLIVYAMSCLAEKCIPGCWLKAGCWSCINAFEAFKSIPVRWHLASICIEPLRSLLDQMLFLFLWVSIPILSANPKAMIEHLNLLDGWWSWTSMSSTSLGFRCNWRLQSTGRLGSLPSQRWHLLAAGGFSKW